MGKEKLGSFIKAISLGKKDLNSERIESIHSSTQTAYKRAVEDAEMKIKNLKINRKGLLDMSSQGEMMKSSEYAPIDFVKEDASISCEIKSQELILEVLEERYKDLFE